MYSAVQNSRLPTPDSRLPTPDSRLPTPDSRLPTPDSRLPTPDSRLPTPDSRLPTPDSRLPTPDSRLPTPDSRLPTPDSYQSFISKTEISLRTYNYMIQYFDIKEPRGFLDFQGKFFIALLGRRLPEGWLWQRIRLTASSSSAFFRMIRGSATVPVIPPELTISKCMILLARFRKTTAKISCGRSLNLACRYLATDELLVTSGLSRFSVASRRRPSSRAAAILMALAIPIPLIFIKFTEWKAGQVQPGCFCF